MTAINTYIFSGLGADKRIFSKLRFPVHINPVHIDWIPPVEDEEVEAYALRIMGNIDTVTPFYIIGVSFGGMIATEISKVLHPLRTIIISSAATLNDIPPSFRTAGRLHINYIIPTSLLRSANFITYWLFGTETKEEKALLKKILQDTDPAFLKWALTAIAKWRNVIRPGNIVQIHGTADKIFPVKYVHANITVQRGGHLMVYSKALEISVILESLLKP